MARILLKVAGAEDYTDYSQYFRWDGIGVINERADTGLFHVQSGDCRLIGNNKSEIFDDLFAESDLEDDIWVKIYIENEEPAFFSGVIVNSSVEFNDANHRCSFNVFSASKHYWERLNYTLAAGWEWGSEACKKQTTLGTWCYDIVQVVKKLIAYYTGMSEDEVEVDDYLNSQGFLSVGTVEEDTGIRYGHFRELIGSAMYTAGTTVVVITRDAQDNQKFIKLNNKLKVYDDDNEFEFVINYYEITSTTIYAYFDIPLSDTISINGYCDYLPDEQMHAKDFLQHIEFALRGVIRFGEGSANFDSIYTLLQAAAVNIDNLNPGKEQLRRPFLLEERSYGYAWKRETAKELIYEHYAQIDAGTPETVNDMYIIDTDKTWETNEHKGKYLFCYRAGGLGHHFIVAILEIMSNSTNTIYASPIPAETVIYKIMEQSADYVAGDIWAYVGEEYGSMEMRAGSLQYGTREESHPYFFEEKWVDPATWSGINYPPLVIPMVVLHWGFYNYTKGIRSYLQIEVDFNESIKPLTRAEYLGTEYLVMNVDTNAVKKRMRLELSKMWEWM